MHACVCQLVHGAPRCTCVALLRLMPWLASRMVPLPACVNVGRSHDPQPSGRVRIPDPRKTARASLFRGRGRHMVHAWYVDCCGPGPGRPPGPFACLRERRSGHYAAGCGALSVGSGGPVRPESNPSATLTMPRTLNACSTRTRTLDRTCPDRSCTASLPPPSLCATAHVSVRALPPCTAPPVPRPCTALPLVPQGPTLGEAARVLVHAALPCTAILCPAPLYRPARCTEGSHPGRGGTCAGQRVPVRAQAALDRILR